MECTLKTAPFHLGLWGVLNNTPVLAALVYSHPLSVGLRYGLFLSLDLVANAKGDARNNAA